IPSAATGGTFNPNNYNISYQNGTLTVNAATLSITANADSKTYGQTRTYGAGSTAFSSTGLQNSESIGSVTITASGGTAANASVGSYNLTPSAATGGTFNPNNYNISYQNGTLTVSKASTTTGLTTSGTPALPTDNVTFTATVGSVSPSTAVPTGTVQFKKDGSNLGSPVALSGGQAA